MGVRLTHLLLNSFGDTPKSPPDLPTDKYRILAVIDSFLIPVALVVASISITIACYLLVSVVASGLASLDRYVAPSGNPKYSGGYPTPLFSVFGPESSFSEWVASYALVVHSVSSSVPICPPSNLNSSHPLYAILDSLPGITHNIAGTEIPRVLLWYKPAVITLCVLVVVNVFGMMGLVDLGYFITNKNWSLDVLSLIFWYLIATTTSHHFQLDELNIIFSQFWFYGSAIIFAGAGIAETENAINVGSKPHPGKIQGGIRYLWVQMNARLSIFEIFVVFLASFVIYDGIFSVTTTISLIQKRIFDNLIFPIFFNQLTTSHQSSDYIFKEEP